MNDTPSSGLYKPLGKKLKHLRDKAKETLAEASGAVEIDVKVLAGYELGQSRPSEDVLLLLISHFGVRDTEAVTLWELAGYGSQKVAGTHLGNDSATILPIVNDSDDQRIMFTDIVDVIVNNYGVVMNFMQGAGPNAKPNTVARVGMSREHAKSVLQILQVTLSQTEHNFPKAPKKLSTPDNNQSESQA
jgi:transcriptional regulator with XRE-family HTH domain